MRSQHIRALTGVRFFAALWVVVYHSTRHNGILLANHHPEIRELVWPVTSAGVRGVDLFFMLSGFVLALNYMDRLGDRFELRPTLRFLWLRLARIWPLYMLVIVGAGLLRVIRHDLWNSAGTGPLTWTNLLRQGLMVQQWFPPGPRADQLGGSGLVAVSGVAGVPAVPGPLVLVVARFHRRLRAGRCWCWPVSRWCRWWSASRCEATWAATSGSCASCASSPPGCCCARRRRGCG